MKILFDQGTPAPLRHALAGHWVATAFEKGWSNLQNGDLIRVAEADGFNALITTDQNLKYQQNLRGRRLAILIVPTTSWPKIQKRLDKVFAAVNALTPGEFRELDFGA
jgi:predicted nuclease of predicted toxin-antitoxin system